MSEAIQLSDHLSMSRVTEETWHHVLELELEWPESQRASPETLAKRFAKYPDGFLLAWHEQTAAGLLTFVPVKYSSDDLSGFESWDQVTNGGDLHWPVEKANALYIVSGLVRSGYHDKHIFEFGVSEVAGLAKQLGYDYVLAGARIPGYRRFFEKHGPIAAHEYAALEHRGRLRDPLLQMYRALDFNVPNANHIKADYYPDESSMDHGALVVHQIAA
ncbi:MAG: hypothetical protein AAF541_17175 [Pseudomonadota bacterium]